MRSNIYISKIPLAILRELAQQGTIGNDLSLPVLDYIIGGVVCVIVILLLIISISLCLCIEYLICVGKFKRTRQVKSINSIFLD